MRTRFIIEVENSDEDIAEMEKEAGRSYQEVLDNISDPTSAENHGMRSEFETILGDGVKSFRAQNITDGS